MIPLQLLSTQPPVALRKESVDRNYVNVLATQIKNRVALRKESVDRNLLRGCCDSIFERGRSPQGERG